jgi:2'-5' RNA ligase
VRPHFTPHVTLLYDEQGVGEDDIEPTRWTVAEFALVHSRRGQGPYAVLARFPLCGALPAAS